jgi:signal transduction histidine kinase
MAQVADSLDDFEPVTVDLRQTLLDVAAECHRAATLRSQACHVDVPDEPVHVAGRPEELHSMLANLAGNAIKYSHDGDRIDVRLTVEGDEVQVSFTDTGIGIAEVDKPHLFREFFRSTNPDALRRPGTGLGLAIVDRIVKRHSGRVELDSRLGHGTTATVTLPVHRAEERVSAE